ncbi:transposase [Streptomyces flaveolus]|uniref:transposase n=1 Tax=Streptomyces flaveolus TaxID=67297 RepID=UPI003D9EB1B4
MSHRTDEDVSEHGSCRPPGELTESAWKRIAPLLPRADRQGRPWRDHRQVIDGMLWRLRTGTPWRDVPTATAPGRPSASASPAGRRTAPGRSCSNPKLRGRRHIPLVVNTAKTPAAAVNAWLINAKIRKGVPLQFHYRRLTG